MQQITKETLEIAFVAQRYTGEQPAQDAAAEGIQLEVVKLPEAKKCFVLLQQVGSRAQLRLDWAFPALSEGL